MKFNITTQEEFISAVKEHVVNTSEVIEILGCSRQNVNKLVQKGILRPIKEMVRDKLFLKSDVLAYDEKRKKL